MASMEASSKLKLLPDDLLVYSAKVIPGNDKRCMKMFNRISEMGLRIANDRSDGLHARCPAPSPLPRSASTCPTHPHPGSPHRSSRRSLFSHCLHSTGCGARRAAPASMHARPAGTPRHIRCPDLIPSTRRPSAAAVRTPSRCRCCVVLLRRRCL